MPRREFYPGLSDLGSNPCIAGRNNPRELEIDHVLVSVGDQPADLDERDAPPLVPKILQVRGGYGPAGCEVGRAEERIAPGVDGCER